MGKQWHSYCLNTIGNQTEIRLLQKPSVTSVFSQQEIVPSDSKILSFVTMGGSRSVWGYQFNNKFNYCTDPRYFREHLWILCDLLKDLEEWIFNSEFPQLVLASQIDLYFLQELIWWIEYQHTSVHKEHPELKRLASILLFFSQQADQDKAGCVVLEKIVNREWLRTGTQQNIGYWVGDKPLSPIFYPTGTSETDLINALEIKIEKKNKIESKVRRQLNNNPHTPSKDIKSLHSIRQEVIQAFQKQEPVSLLDRHNISLQIWQKYWTSFPSNQKKSAGWTWKKKIFLQELKILKDNLNNNNYFVIHPQRMSFVAQSRFFLEAEHYQTVTQKLLNREDRLAFESQIVEGEFAQVASEQENYISQQTNLRLRVGDKVYLYQDFNQPIDTTEYTVKNIIHVSNGTQIKLDSPLVFEEVQYIIPKNQIYLPKEAVDSLNLDNLYHKNTYTHNTTIEKPVLEEQENKNNWLEELQKYSRHPQIEKNIFTQTLEDILQQQVSAHITLVDSPPGAGKTGVIEHVAVMNSQLLHKKVLIMTQTNSQLLDLANRITNNWKTPVYILSAKGIEYSKKQLGVKNLEYVTEAENSSIKTEDPHISIVYNLNMLPPTPHIVIATSSKIKASKYLEESYDLQIVEEAYQMADHMWLQTSAIAKQFFLVGDPKQINPVTSVAELMQPFEQNPYPTHFSAPRNLVKRHNIDVHQLPVSRRLPQDSAEFLQENLYSHDFKFTALSHYPKDRYIVPTSSLSLFEKQSLFAVESKQQEYLPVIEHILSQTQKMSIYDDRWGDNKQRKIEDKDIGIICTNREQVQSLKALSAKMGMPNVFCETAERYQGREQLFMIVLHPLWGDLTNIDFLTDPGKLSVMLSRHRVGCIIVLPPHPEKTLEEIPLKDKQQIVTLQQSIPEDNPILLNLKVLKNLDRITL